MPKDRLLAVVLLALTLAVGAGCSSPGTDTSGSSAQSSADDSGSQAAPPTEEESVVDGGGVEEGSGTDSEQESSGDEEAAAAADGGGGGVSVQLAGLPAGGGSSVAVGEAWCQALFWGSQLPVGVLLEIDAVQVGEPGGTLHDVACEDKPPCVGATISDDQRGCAVAVIPPSPAPELVRVRLDGTLRCPDQATCDQVDVSDGAWIAIFPPSTVDPTAETAVGEPTQETGSGAGSGVDPSPEGGASLDPSTGDGEIPSPTGS